MSCTPTPDTQYCQAQQTSDNSLLGYSAKRLATVVLIQGQAVLASF